MLYDYVCILERNFNEMERMLVARRQQEEVDGSDGSGRPCASSDPVESAIRSWISVTIEPI